MERAAALLSSRGEHNGIEEVHLRALRRRREGSALPRDAPARVSSPRTIRSEWRALSSKPHAPVCRSLRSSRGARFRFGAHCRATRLMPSRIGRARLAPVNAAIRRVTVVKSV
jgi:hypothetical protein